MAGASHRPASRAVDRDRRKRREPGHPHGPSPTHRRRRRPAGRRRLGRLRFVATGRRRADRHRPGPPLGVQAASRRFKARRSDARRERRHALHRVVGQRRPESASPGALRGDGSRIWRRACGPAYEVGPCVTIRHRGSAGERASGLGRGRQRADGRWPGVCEPLVRAGQDDCPCRIVRCRQVNAS